MLKERKSIFLWITLVFFIVFGLFSSSASAFDNATYVILISVDGLRPDGITNLGTTTIPNFYKFRTDGSFTDNARNDYDYTVTLPNHITQITSRGVTGSGGHGWTGNVDPDPGDTLHNNKGSYVAGAFDAVHDNGLRTGLYTGKSKFILFDQSFSSTTGAIDVTGEDNGQDKIDTYLYNSSSTVLISSYVSAMQSNPFNFSLLHIPNLDSIGHASGWDPTVGTAYSNGVITVDGYLSSIFDLVETDPDLSGNTVIILTSDHGGTGTDHSNASLSTNYTIPFYVWGKDISEGTDLYEMNSAVRLDPSTGRPNYSEAIQPIRNGDAGNLSNFLLGLPVISSSTINALQDLSVKKLEMTYSAGSNGTLTGSTTQILNYGEESSSVTAVPDDNYHFTLWSDGSTENPRSDIATSALSVTANFSIDTFTLTYVADSNGYLTGSTTQTVDYGSSGSEVEAVADSGYQFQRWSDSSNTNPRIDTNVTSNATYTATFESTSSGGRGGGGGGRSSKTATSSVGLFPYFSNLNTVEAILAKIRELQALIVILQGGGVTNLNGGVCLYARDLFVGSVGFDVSCLQKVLNNNGYKISSVGPGSIGNETTNFGELTRLALIKFQIDKGITPASGYFGPKTRDMMRSLGLIP